MSRFHFLRHFALLHGATPHAYVVRRRTAAARRMLADGVTDPAVVARRSGFGSRSSLYRALGGRLREATVRDAKASAERHELLAVESAER
jgi:AraC-like DNA-binding protein